MSMFRGRAITVPVILIAGLAGFNSCKKNFDGRSSSAAGSLDAASILSTGGYLKPSDFDVEKSKLGSMDSNRLRIEVSSQRAFFAKAPSKGAASTNLLEDTCTQDEFNKLIVRSSSSTIMIDGRPELKKCLEKANSSAASGGKFTFSKYDFRILIVFECEGVDLSKWDGKTYKELVDSTASGNICAGATKERLVQNSGTEMEGEFEYDGQKSVISSKTLSGLMTSDGKPCAKESQSSGGAKLIGECLEMDTNIDNSVGGRSDRFVGKESGLVTKGKDDLYYSEGTIKFEINDWSGEMTYTDASKAPTWKAKGGAENQEVTGTFGESFEKEPESTPEATPTPEANQTPTETPTPGGASLRQAGVPAPKLPRLIVPIPFH